MPWSSPASATQLTSITTIQYFSFGGSAMLSLLPGETMKLAVSVNFPASPTDDAIVEVFDSLDAGTSYATTPSQVMSVSRLIDPNTEPMVIKNTRHFRVGIRRSGSTDTLTTADAVYIKDGVSLS